LIAKHITAVSSTLRREAIKLYDIPDWKIDIVPNGIVPDHYQADVDPEEVKRRYGFDPDSPLILFVGRLAWQKGPDMLVDAAPGLLREHSGSQFALRRRRADAPGLETRARSLPVRFLGRLDDAGLRLAPQRERYRCHPEQKRTLRACAPRGVGARADAWLRPTSAGSPRTSSMGPMGSRCGPHPDSIAKGLAVVADSPGKSLCMGRKGFEKVKECFQWNRVAERMEKSYRKAANRGTILC